MLPSDRDASACMIGRDGAVSCTLGDDRPPEVLDGVTDAVRFLEAGDERCAQERSGAVVCWSERAPMPHAPRAPLVVPDAAH